MTPKEFAEVLAIIDKLKIEFNPYLSHDEKELWKQFVDYLKNQVPSDAQF